MFFRAKRALHRAWFDFNCSALLKTAPLHSNDDRLTIVSMLCHGEVRMYLLAVKSFCLQLGRIPKVVILDDGSLTEDDRATVRKHIPGIKFYGIADVPLANCPKRNCWERLLLISDLVQDTYVVQLDSDTLTSRVIPEVIQCIAENRSFTLLGDRSYPEIETMASAAERAKNNPNRTVQEVCERAFDQLPESDTLKYLRGNAGFTGFAKGSIDRKKIEEFSALMRSITKERWDEWGSEQVASNILIANTEGACALPFPQYLSYWTHPNVDYNSSFFIHFIGPFRFANGFYLKKAKEAIAKM